MSNILCYTFHNDQSWMRICQTNWITKHSYLTWLHSTPFDLSWLHIRLHCLLQERLFGMKWEVNVKKDALKWIKYVSCECDFSANFFCRCHNQSSHSCIPYAKLILYLFLHSFGWHVLRRWHLRLIFGYIWVYLKGMNRAIKCYSHGIHLAITPIINIQMTNDATIKAVPVNCTQCESLGRSDGHSFKSGQVQSLIQKSS